VEDLDDREIIELYAPNITFADPADPSGIMGKQHGYMKIRNNGIDPVKVDLDIYIKEPSYIETTVYNSSIVLSPSGTKNITFYYSVNLEELEEDGICGFYSLTPQVTYKVAYSAMSIGIEVLQPGTFIEVDTPLNFI
jgi:hypothetical protein